MIEAIDVSKTKLLTVRMTEEEYDRLDRLAHKKRTTASELVRSLIVKEDQAVAATVTPDEMFERATRLYRRELRRDGGDLDAVNHLNPHFSGFNTRGVYELRGGSHTDENPKGWLAGRYVYDADTDQVKSAGEKKRTNTKSS